MSPLRIAGEVKKLHCDHYRMICSWCRRCYGCEGHHLIPTTEGWHWLCPDGSVHEAGVDAGQQFFEQEDVMDCPRGHVRELWLIIGAGERAWICGECGFRMMDTGRRA